MLIVFSGPAWKRKDNGCAQTRSQAIGNIPPDRYGASDSTQNPSPQIDLT